VKYLGIFWAILMFVGIPIWYTLQLFYEFEPPNKITTISFIVVIFITSFWNVFRRNHEFMLFPQILKMLLAVYVTIFGFASIYKYAGLHHGADLITHQSIDALYFSIVTWTTLGYGDLQPTESIKLLAALEAMLGTLFIPLLLAAIIFALQSNKSHNK
jgi:hypothetical protein